MTLSLRNSKPTQMTAKLSVGRKQARVLLDTRTVGTNLMSANWAQANQIPTEKMKQPCEIRMATKNSRATANYSATAEVNIGKGRGIWCEFFSSYWII